MKYSFMEKVKRNCMNMNTILLELTEGVGVILTFDCRSLAGSFLLRGHCMLLEIVFVGQCEVFVCL